MFNSMLVGTMAELKEVKYFKHGHKKEMTDFQSF